MRLRASELPDVRPHQALWDHLLRHSAIAPRQPGPCVVGRLHILHPQRIHLALYQQNDTREAALRYQITVHPDARVVVSLTVKVPRERRAQRCQEVSLPTHRKRVTAHPAHRCGTGPIKVNHRVNAQRLQVSEARIVVVGCLPPIARGQQRHAARSRRFGDSRGGCH